jgi:hypothetical protein
MTVPNDRERREMRKTFVFGVIVLACVPLAFIVVVRNTMEVGDCLGGSGACPTASGVALGVACAGGLRAVACVLIGRARNMRR